ncbi:protein of unknown function [Pseudodesulfovibrio piezophilus C1TLV30]|uniref:Uncharacterized protein n=1 Tax=Pseudodesulfovibrio piezophilus (strain DSM 21447 / JCM 15486 / C1TLV30) TaxID=1322246 RepID=M1WLT7_PSEP2|nr:protein of unknown function [Pseudodesulfovibrio piezophilus C1TLV30]
MTFSVKKNYISDRHSNVPDGGEWLLCDEGISVVGRCEEHLVGEGIFSIK